MVNKYKIGERGERPWGYWQVDEIGNGFVKKTIVVNAGGALSLQSHKYRREEWEIVDGSASVVLDDGIFSLQKGDKIAIPQYAKHQLKNAGSAKLIVKETQLGEILDEADIVRYEDAYGRADAAAADCLGEKSDAGKKYYIVSGGFDPIHEGHIAMIRDAASKSDGVILLLNSDAWLIRKKGKNFMNVVSRKIVCDNIKGVIDVLEFNDDDGSASDGIKLAREKYPYAQLIFANGGDRTNSNIPEGPTCEKYCVRLEFGVGGTFKANSSSWILKNWVE